METKKCSKCKEDKFISEYDKGRSYCISCRRTCRRARRLENRLQENEKAREYRNKNKEMINKYQNLWYHKNKEIRKEYVNNASREWRLKNPEKRKRTVTKWLKRNPDYKKNKYNNDFNYRLAVLIRTRVYGALRNNQQTGKALNLLGCTMSFFKLYIENQFEPGMTWDNQGEWHFDHIKPLSSFNLKDEEQFKKAAYYTNLQPLWAIDNLKKGAKSEPT